LLPLALPVPGDQAFKGCTGITAALDLDREGLERIGDSAFHGCTRITALQLPAGLQSVGDGSSRGPAGAFHGCSSLGRILAPDALVQGNMAAPAKVFGGCPGLRDRLQPHSALSAVPLLRHTLWHPTRHMWCTAGERQCVLAVLVAELRSDRQAEPAVLPSLAHDLWLLILQFVPRRQLGRRV